MNASSDKQRRQITENILRRKDPHIVEFLHSCDHVVLYKHVDSTWEHTQIEGAMHVVSRDEHPFVQLIIYNRKSTQNFYHDFTAQNIQLQQQIPYILFRHSNNPNDIYGLWFYNKVQAMSFVDQYYKLKASSSSTAPPQQQQQQQYNAPQSMNQPRMVHLTDMSRDLTQMLRTQLNIQPPTSAPMPQQQHYGSGSNPGDQIMQMLNGSSQQQPPQQQQMSYIAPSVSSVEQSVQQQRKDPSPPSRASTLETNKSTSSSRSKSSENNNSRSLKKKSKPEKKEKNVSPSSNVPAPKTKTSVRILKRGQDVAELKATPPPSDGPSNGSSESREESAKATSKTTKSPQRKRPKNPKSTASQKQKTLSPTPSPSSSSSDTAQTNRKNTEKMLKMLPPQFIYSELHKLNASKTVPALESVETKNQFKECMVQLISNDNDTRFLDSLYRHFMLSKKFGDKLSESSSS
uniref:mRNA-decapping enzyme C-terminal domain-containing protein n=1 Tax=Percolomonas cosmopolitus TaxID=63605 RepID=A0A7S1KV82_9EUKA|mmetsp:Transcript_998/g.3441  ORF Transcript_998/g.3441 Transcript_998/m.3441 type:complete len:460 (+) Transcript_998:315-1694(+)